MSNKNSSERNEHGETFAQTPDRFHDLEVSEPKETAAGFPAIYASMRDSFEKMGVVRSILPLLKMNQTSGFDCQSCAWADPEPQDRKIIEWCESGAKALSDEAMTETIGAEFFAKHSVAYLSEQSDHWLNKQGRLAKPMILRRDATHYAPISWTEAFQTIAQELNALESPDEAVFYTSGRTSNEAAFLYQLFVRQFGTNNLPDCSNMCHESTSVGLKEVTGLGKASIKIDDFKHCDLIIIYGQNPGTNAPRMMASLQHAKDNGAKIIAVNPLPEAGLLNFVNPNPQDYRNPLKFPIDLVTHHGVHLADLYLPVRVGGDMALIKGVCKVLLEREANAPDSILDNKFIREKTEGFEAFAEEIRRTDWNLILEESGIARDQIEKFADMVCDSKALISCWAMGITQHENAVATIQDLVAINLLRGQIGKKGAGVCPVRGHSNVQGDRTMGIWEKMPEEFLSALDKEFNFESPREEGFDTVKAIKAFHEGRAKVFFAMGGNFLQATPDTNFTAEALQKSRLSAFVITKLNRSALVVGEQALILPCLGRSEKDFQKGVEQFVSCESTTLAVQQSKGVLEPVSKHLLSETRIIAELAKATLGAKSTVDWDKMADNYDHIRDSIGRVVEGCENYNRRIRHEGGFYLPNKPHEGEFPTDSGKAKFFANVLKPAKREKGRFTLTSVRSHDQFNTTVYALNDRYRGIHGERRVIFMNDADIAEQGFKAGDVVDLTSHYEDGERHVHKFIIVPYPIPKGDAAAYFPEVNPLVAINNTAKESNTPVYKSIEISISRHNAEV